jgi:patatin-like phospholipase/acyl hydrolase
MAIQYHAAYHNHPVYRRMMAPGPKRILALDGGGIRGALTIGFLEEIEDLLRKRYNNPHYRLYQYYDLIGGTSTGAIIATLLAKGESVANIKKLYLELGEEIFAHLRYPWAPNFLRYFMYAKYQTKPLKSNLMKTLGQMTLASEEFKTGLCVVCRRADNYHTYAFTNHPHSKYFDKNKGLKMVDIIRATSAAPSYFRSKMLEFQNGEKGVFIDGGVSSANNPSLLLFMTATLENFGYNWYLGTDELLITSIGTGFYRPKSTNLKKSSSMRTIMWAKELPNLFMADATELNDSLLQHLAQPIRSKPKQELMQNADVYADRTTGAFTYHRYDVRLGTTALQAYGVETNEAELVKLREMDIGENAAALFNIGSTVAKHEIKAEHFPNIFDYTAEHLQKHVIEKGEFKSIIQAKLKANGKWYKKNAHVRARIAEEGEQVITVADDFVETSNVAHAGDYLVENQTSDKEQYIIRQQKFAERYTIRQTLPDGTMDCIPIGKVIAIQLTGELLKALGLPPHFLFEASWGESQYARAGDFIVCNSDYDDIYRISQKIFYETYDIDELQSGDDVK